MKYISERCQKQINWHAALALRRGVVYADYVARMRGRRAIIRAATLE